MFFYVFLQIFMKTCRYLMTIWEPFYFNHVVFLFFRDKHNLSGNDYSEVNNLVIIYCFDFDCEVDFCGLVRGIFANERVRLFAVFFVCEATHLPPDRGEKRMHLSGQDSRDKDDVLIDTKSSGHAIFSQTFSLFSIERAVYFQNVFLLQHAAQICQVSCED